MRNSALRHKNPISKYTSPKQTKDPPRKLNTSGTRYSVQTSLNPIPNKIHKFPPPHPKNGNPHFLQNPVSQGRVYPTKQDRPNCDILWRTHPGLFYLIGFLGVRQCDSATWTGLGRLGSPWLTPLTYLATLATLA